MAAGQHRNCRAYLVYAGDMWTNWSCWKNQRAKPQPWEKSSMDLARPEQRLGHLWQHKRPTSRPWVMCSWQLLKGPKTPLAPGPSEIGPVQTIRRAVLILKARDVILRFDCLCLITALFHEFAGLGLSAPSLVGEIHFTHEGYSLTVPAPPGFVWWQSFLGIQSSYGGFSSNLGLWPPLPQRLLLGMSRAGLGLI